MKTYTLKLSSGTAYKLYDGTTLVTDTDLGTLFGTAGSAYFVFDFNSGTPSDLTAVSITDSSDATVMGTTGLAAGTVKENYNFKGSWDGTATTFTSFAQLTGQAMDEAEMSFLMGKVKESLGNLGKAKLLTTADYNYPVDNPTALAPWLLDPGLYYIGDSDIWIRRNNSESALSLKRITMLVGPAPHANSSVKKMLIWSVDMSAGKFLYAQMYYGNGAGALTSTGYGISLPVGVYNSLTSDSTSAALSANQGKVLKDLIDSLAFKNAGAPTTATVGTVGQLLEDTTNGKLYQCTAVDTTTDPSNPSYTWTEVGAGGSGPTVVQTTGTSQTDVMSQEATTKLVYRTGGDKTRIQIGQQANATGDGNYPIAIGVSASVSGVQNNATAIGHYATASSNYALAIGSGTSAATSARASGGGSIALGTNSSASTNAVAFAYGHATEQGQFDVGVSNGFSAGYQSSNYRLITGVYDPQSAHDAATKGYVDGTTETYTIATSDWTALTSSSPYTYQATVTATYTIGANTVAELLNDNPVAFATNGFAIGSISSQSVTIYSIGQPSASVSLKVNYKG